MSSVPNLPESGFVRIAQILGKPKAKPPLLPIIPVSKSTWWAGCRSGKFPSPVKLSVGVTAWRVEDIRALLDKHQSQDKLLNGGGV